MESVTVMACFLINDSELAVCLSLYSRWAFCPGPLPHHWRQMPFLGWRPKEMDHYIFLFSYTLNKQSLFVDLEKFLSGI